jgi:ESS family glutamate:Na+ symporter
LRVWSAALASLPSWLQEIARALPWLLLAMAALAVLLGLGRAIGERLQLKLVGIPEALVAGLIGLALAPSGPLPLLPAPVMQLWADLPLVLLTLVFATLLLAKPLPKLAGLWRPVSAQVLLALTLAFGQFLVAGLAVLLLLQPWLGVSPLMACLIEVAYEGGHGSAAAMGPSYASLGFPAGEALGLALSTVGLLASTLVGGVLVVVGRSQGWTSSWPAPAAQGNPAEAGPAPSVQAEAPAGTIAPQGPLQTLVAWAVNLALAGVAVLVGVSLLALLRGLAGRSGGGFALVIDSLPVFPLALVGSILVRLVLERLHLDGWVSARIQGQTGTLSADLLITAATAGLDLALLRQDWLPLTVLSLAGLLWNLAVVLLLAPRILPKDWFERAVIEFGQATGVAASGLLLLRMADPDDRSEALQAFSIKQLLLQPFLAGGVITVVAPLVISGWGLPAWTALCFGLVLVWVSLGLVLASRRT